MVNILTDGDSRILQEISFLIEVSSLYLLAPISPSRTSLRARCSSPSGSPHVVKVHSAAAEGLPSLLKQTPPYTPASLWCQLTRWVTGDHHSGWPACQVPFCFAALVENLIQHVMSNFLQRLLTVISIPCDSSQTQLMCLNSCNTFSVLLDEWENINHIIKNYLQFKGTIYQIPCIDRSTRI